jgi:hypothetical protein
MQRRKIVVSCLSLILATLAISSISTPKAHAAVSSTVSLSGLGVNGFTDPLTGNTVDGIAASSTLTVTVAVLAPSSPSEQHNVTVGFKGDWMNSYQNATNANQGSLALTASQQATETIPVTMPSTGGLTAYSWTVIVCDGPVNSKTSPCSFTSSSSSPYHSLAAYTSDQLSAAQASVQAASTISNVNSELALITSSTLQKPAGTTAAAGQIAQANTELSLGKQSWLNGDYSGAKTHYQNALNDANAAAGSLTGQGGGVDEANLVNLVLGGTGIMLVGVGALLAGLGVFFRYMRKPKA